MAQADRDPAAEHRRWLASVPRVKWEAGPHTGGAQLFADALGSARRGTHGACLRPAGVLDGAAKGGGERHFDTVPARGRAARQGECAEANRGQRHAREQHGGNGALAPAPPQRL